MRPKCLEKYLALGEKKESANIENCVMRNLTCLLLTNYCLGDHVKEVEMEEDCSTRVELINVYILFGTPEGKYWLGDISIDGRRILKWVSKK